MKISFKHLVIMMLAIITLPQIICADNEYQWRSASFDTISLTSITQQSDEQTGSSMLILDISGADTEAVITADNSTDAQLHNSTDTLVTKYKLKLDGDGSSKSGGTPTETEWFTYDTFLSGGLNIKYVPGDADVQVTLYVRASNRPGEVADSGNYTARQTITVTWDGL